MAAIDQAPTKVKVIFNLFSQDGSGHQVYDGGSNVRGRQDVRVIEPMVFVSHKVDEKTDVRGLFVFDLWTAASDTSLDGTTGASGKGIEVQNRVAANLGATHHTKVGDVSYGAGFSTEFDYRSFNAQGSWSQNFAQDNFTLAASAQLYKDQVNRFDYVAKDMKTEWEDRDIYSLGISGTQLLTRQDVAQLGVDYVVAEGTLESTASSLLINGARVGESLPHGRHRQAYWGRWVHGFNETFSLNTLYRFYEDDWGVAAHTGRVAFLSSVQDDDGVLEFAYRYHRQEAVDYYAHGLTAARPLMTSDSDMAAFTAHEYGAFYRYNDGAKTFDGVKLHEFTYSFSLNYYHRNIDTRAVYAQAGVAFGI